MRRAPLLPVLALLIAGPSVAGPPRRVLGKVGSFEVVAIADGRSLTFVLHHAQIEYPDCSEVKLTTDVGPLAASTHVERGKVDCGGTDSEELTLRVDPAAVATLRRARTLSFDLCGDTLAPTPRRWLADVQKLLK